MANLFFERPDTGERAVVVHIDFSCESQREELDEFKLLVESAGVVTLDTVVGKRDRPDPKLFVGSGKADEIGAAVVATGAEVVLFNHSLSPAQQRNLEKLLSVRVVDRTGVILDIFAQRARTHEGKLQVELAQLIHLSTRLVRGWTHLERQKGGIGLRGPGETQLESDRRMVRTRIQYIQKQLSKVRRHRAVGRRARKKNDIPIVSVVGYTNTGKSTLFNRMTDANVYAQDQLFATLDTTLRQLVLPNFGKIILADTVGFIRHLPHQLVEAFKATLEETTEADLLLHVVDISNQEWRECVEQVNKVLVDIGADRQPTLVVYNKLDLTEMSPKVEIDEFGDSVAVWVSAKTGQGLDLLAQAIAQRLSQQTVSGVLRLNFEHGALRAQLYDRGLVLSEQQSSDHGYILNFSMPKHQLDILLAQNGLKPDCVELES